MGSLERQAAQQYGDPWEGNMRERSSTELCLLCWPARRTAHLAAVPAGLARKLGWWEVHSAWVVGQTSSKGVGGLFSKTQMQPGKEGRGSVLTAPSWAGLELAAR